MCEENSCILFSFGLIADVQYADIENATREIMPEKKCTRTRYYRNSLRLLREAVADWNSQELKPAFVIQLGDLFDANNQDFKKNRGVLHVTRTCSSLLFNNDHGQNKFFVCSTLIKVNSNDKCCSIHWMFNAYFDYSTCHVGHFFSMHAVFFKLWNAYLAESVHWTYASFDLIVINILINLWFILNTGLAVSWWQIAMKELNLFSGSVYHVMGNHEYYAFTHAQLAEMFPAMMLPDTENPHPERKRLRYRLVLRSQCVTNLEFSQALSCWSNVSRLRFSPTC